ncbi:MAG: DUF4338 domain-containing protein [Anaerolineales bacterium]|nr:DUF4338 domain-containing protein [Anaerolineales bacterium]
MNNSNSTNHNGHLTKEHLRQLIFEELERLEFTLDEQGNIVPPDTSKEVIRRLHETSRNIELQKSQQWIKSKLNKYKNYFANGYDITPEKIKPRLVQVTDNWQNDLFRLIRLTWSLPYSFGYGRRLRYLILDEHNDKIMGIFALQSPPIRFPARDNLFNYPQGKKVELINQTMDIHTLGAIPPYSILLGGKLVALATSCNQVRTDYVAKYAERKTEMEDRILPAHLVALTTTSAFGRSSIYNRLKYKSEVIAQSIGYTEGYGNFHLQKLYPVFKEYLAMEGVSLKGGYGTGPKRSWQFIRLTLDKVGIPGDLLKHGIQREAFLFPLVTNLKKYLEGEDNTPQYRDLPFDELIDYWRENWMLPRAERVNHWRTYQNCEFLSSLILPEENHNHNGRVS